MKLIEFSAQHILIPSERRRERIDDVVVQATGKSQEFMEGCKSTVIMLKYLSFRLTHLQFQGHSWKIKGSVISVGIRRMMLIENSGRKIMQTYFKELRKSREIYAILFPPEYIPV